MKKISLLFVVLLISIAATACSAGSGSRGYKVGVASADITPEGNVVIAGNSSSSTATAVDFPLEAKAVVIGSGDTKAVFITLDTLKYPLSLYEEARDSIEKATGIPGDNIMITSSHTHSGPHYADYNGSLTQVMTDIVKEAVKDMEPCKIGVSKTEVSGVSHNRRRIVDGEAWNDWMIKVSQPWNYYPTNGELDEEMMVIAAVDNDGNFKTVLWNFACHPNSNGSGNISSDYPGKVQDYLCEKLGKDIKVLYLTGASGDVNPSNGTESVGNALGDAMIKCLTNLTYIDNTELKVASTRFNIADREDPVFNEEEIALKWPDTLESYRASFDGFMKLRGNGKDCVLNAVNFGDKAVVISDPGELFASLGLDIKEQSPFEYTLVTEQTNGAIGYLPAVSDFDDKGYETWYGEHSNLCKSAGEDVVKESLILLEEVYGTEDK